MFRWFIVLMASMVLVEHSDAQDLPPIPKGPIPDYKLATATEKDGRVIVRFTQQQYSTKNATITENGKTVTRAVTEVKWVEEPVNLHVDGKEVRVLADGKDIDPKTLLKRLAKPTSVVVFSFLPPAEPKPDLFYLRMLREDVVVFAASSEKFMPPPRK